jgi:plasmid stabilization system protein ParE
VSEYHVELLNPAWLDLDAISDFHLREVGPASARRITDRILSALERLEIFPLSCPLAPYKELADKGYRILVCGEYVCIYVLIGKTVYVHHIVAGAANYPALFE